MSSAALGPGFSLLEDSSRRTSFFVEDRLWPSFIALDRAQRRLESDGTEWGVVWHRIARPALLLFGRDLRLYAAGAYVGLFDPPETLTSLPFSSDQSELRDQAPQSADALLQVLRSATGWPEPEQLGVARADWTEGVWGSDYELWSGAGLANWVGITTMNVSSAITVSDWLAVDSDVLEFVSRALGPADRWASDLERAKEAFRHRFDFCFCHRLDSSRGDVVQDTGEPVDATGEPSPEADRMHELGVAELDLELGWLFDGALRLLEAVNHLEAMRNEPEPEHSSSYGDQMLQSLIFLLNPLPTKGPRQLWGKLTDGLSHVEATLRQTLPLELQDRLLKTITPLEPPSWWPDHQH